MDMDFISRPELALLGMNFYGDPFKDAGDWSMNNEIGRLTQRFMEYLGENRETFQPLLAGEDFYEVHIYNPETEVKGLFEVFVGHPAQTTHGIPIALSLKILPEGQYAQVHLKGEEIVSDWYVDLDQDLADRGWQCSLPFFFQVYDRRYKGLERIAESELTAYIPVSPL